MINWRVSRMQPWPSQYATYSGSSRDAALAFSICDVLLLPRDAALAFSICDVLLLLSGCSIGLFNMRRTIAPLGMQHWPSQYATYYCSSRDAALTFSICDVLLLLSGCSIGILNMRRTVAPLSPCHPLKSASDRLVDNTLLLKDFLVCHSNQPLQP